MLRSLRFRLLSLMVVVLMVTGGMAAWFASRVIIERFEQYVRSDQVASEGRRQQLSTLLPPILANHYTQNRGWQGIDPLVQHLSELAEERILLIDADATIIFDSAASETGQALANSSEPPTPIVINGQRVGAFAVIPAPLVGNSSGAQAY
ncbi:MAG: hypothetical protein M3Q45_15045, partial [Chloroflexota bacterium]|nr:hypothetical protein [Chloroflexota bacterium]